MKSTLQTRERPALLAPPDRETALEARRYDRIAPIYDALEWVAELAMRGWRRQLWSLVERGPVLELGVGTGKNLPFHPPELDITAIDISEKMLKRARRRAARLSSPIELELADAQNLPYPNASFETVVATFLFCSVPDPIQGLREARRVLAPGGRLLLLEHVLSRHRVIRQLMQLIDPIPFHVWGAHINRDTVSNVDAAGFSDIRVSPRWLDVVLQIEAVACI